MQAGNLNKRITIQQKGTPTRNSHGEEVISWSAVGTFWASVRPKAGREYVEAGQVGAEHVVEFKMRYQPSVTLTTAMRISYDSRIFQIRAIREVWERQREWVLDCVEDVS